MVRNWLFRYFFLNISSHTYINTKFILNIFQVTEEALRLASTQQTNTTKVATIHLQKLEAQVTGLFTFWRLFTQQCSRQFHEIFVVKLKLKINKCFSSNLIFVAKILWNCTTWFQKFVYIVLFVYIFCLHYYAVCLQI